MINTGSASYYERLGLMGNAFGQLQFMEMQKKYKNSVIADGSIIKNAGVPGWTSQKYDSGTMSFMDINALKIQPKKTSEVVVGGQIIDDPNNPGQKMYAPESQLTLADVKKAGGSVETAEQTSQAILAQRAADEERKQSLYGLRKQLGFRSSKSSTGGAVGGGGYPSSGIILG